MAIQSPLARKFACHQCDSLSQMPQLQEGEKACCPCCGAILFSKKKDSLNRTIAVALAGLLLFFPAISLPIIGLSAKGIYNHASLLDCITLMINGDFYILSFTLFILTIAVPLVRLITALYLSLCLKFNKITPSLVIFFRSYHLLESWTMTHVFFMGVIVSMYKLISLAEMSVDIGLLSLVLLLLCSTLVSLTMDSHYIWEDLEAALE